jgi:predicted DNA-binding protein with PD1-like motif
MQSAQEGNMIIIKLDDGEDLLEMIESVIKKHEIGSALIISGIGMLRNFEIGYYNGEKYINEHFVDPMELLSMHGSIAEGEENRIHIHVGVANNEHKMMGGHLMKAKVCMLNEIVLMKLKDIKLTRELNEKSGLMELIISQ